MMGNSVYSVIVVVGFVSLLLVAFTSVPLATDYEATVQESAEWCDNHDGELVQSNVFGPHGGLHCEFENGTSVHMDEVNIGDSG